MQQTQSNCLDTHSAASLLSEKNNFFCKIEFSQVILKQIKWVQTPKLNDILYVCWEVIMCIRVWLSLRKEVENLVRKSQCVGGVPSHSVTVFSVNILKLHQVLEIGWTALARDSKTCVWAAKCRLVSDVTASAEQGRQAHVKAICDKRGLKTALQQEVLDCFGNQQTMVRHRHNRWVGTLHACTLTQMWWSWWTCSRVYVRKNSFTFNFFFIGLLPKRISSQTSSSNFPDLYVLHMCSLC